MINQSENNFREHRKGNQQCQIQKYWQHRGQDIERKQNNATQ